VSTVVVGNGIVTDANLLPTALASQSLSVVNDLIPYVRETFRRHLKQTHTVLLVEFDKLRRVRVRHRDHHTQLNGLFYAGLSRTPE